MPANKMQDRVWLTQSGSTLIAAWDARPGGMDCGDPEPLCRDADSVAFTTSTDGGASWAPARLVYADAPHAVIDGHPIAWDGGKHVVIPAQVVSSVNDADLEFVLLATDDGGVTWTTRAVARGGDEPSFPNVQRAPDGTLVYAFAAGKEMGATVSLTASKDGGASWSRPLDVTTNATFDHTSAYAGDVIAAVGLALAPDGRATLSRMEADNRTGSGPTWALHSARVAPGFARVEASGVAAPPRSGPVPGAFEFLTARTLPDGRVVVLYPWNAPGCARASRRRTCTAGTRSA
jgi:photosystem II stability/assembly factor-like uncharacterized protein